MPGVDYASTFEVPVFRSAASRTAEQAGEADDREHEPPQRKSVVVRPSGEGTEFFFPSARSKGAALALTGFVILWSGAVWLLFYPEAPLLFKVVFTGFDVVLVLAVLSMWLATSSAVVSAETVRVSSRFLGFRRIREFPRGKISGVEIKPGMQSGSKLYYDIALILEAGQAITVGRNIRNKDEAEWVASELRMYVG